MLHKMFEKRQAPTEGETVALSSGDAVDWLTGSSSGSNAEGATLAAAYSCINVIASCIGYLPFEVKQKSKDNTIDVLTNHPLHEILSLSANDWQTASEFRQMVMWNTLIEGNGVTRITRNRRGEVTGLYQEDSTLSSIVRIKNKYRYNITDTAGNHYLKHPDDVLHLRCIGNRTQEAKWARSPIAQTRDTFTVGLEAQNFGKGFFETGGKPTGIYTPINGIKGDAWTKLKSTWGTLMSSGKRNILLPAELKYQAITIPPEDSQFLETMKFNRSQIAGIYNVPPHMIGDLERATFSNISEQVIGFARYTLTPWIVLIEQEFSRKLLTKEERQAGLYLSFDLSGLLRGTAKERSDFYKNALTDGWMNRNEVRVKEGMNRAEGLDEFFVSVNQVHDTNNEGDTDDSDNGKTDV